MPPQSAHPRTGGQGKPHQADRGNPWRGAASDQFGAKAGKNAGDFNRTCPGNDAPRSNPKSEARNPKQNRNPKAELRGTEALPKTEGQLTGGTVPLTKQQPLAIGFRPSDFFRISDFGFRIFIVDGSGLPGKIAR